MLLKMMDKNDSDFSTVVIKGLNIREEGEGKRRDVCTSAYPVYT